MTKRVKKPAVEPKVRRQWFRRHEEDGEPVSEIAKTDGYDVRTVKKLIEIERQAREAKEARGVVLRKALEQHYEDLCIFAQKLNSQISEDRNLLPAVQTDRKWSALREHLPRSPMWKAFERRDLLREDIHRSEQAVEMLMEKRVQSEILKGNSLSFQEEGFSRHVAEALKAHINQAVLGEEITLTEEHFEEIPEAKGLIALDLRRIRIGQFPEEQVMETIDRLRTIIDDVTNSEEFLTLADLHAELRRVQGILHDELETIILRRVVPGRCKYCPI